MLRKLLTTLSTVALAAFVQGAAAASLEEIYELAVQNDPELAAAEASFKAQNEVIAQRRSALLPQVGLQGNTTNTRAIIPVPGVDTDPTSPTFGQQFRIPARQFNSHGWGASLSQPVFRLDSWYRFQQGKNVPAQARAQFAAAQQNLIFRVTEAYLAILEAQAALTSAIAERDAVKRQLEQVQQRFDVGLVAITDVLEAQAAFDNSTVSVIESEGAQNVSFEALLRLTGNPITSVQALVDELPVTPPEPNQEDAWVDRAIAQNFTLLAAREGLHGARSEVKIARAGRLPTVNASANWQHSATAGGNSFFGSKSNNRSLTLSLNIPVYTGGAIASGVRAAGFSLEQAQQNFDFQQRTIVEQTRSLFTAINTDVARVNARRRSIESSESALQATETGYEVGTRNIVEVLQAQRQLYLSQFQYASARYQYIRDNMRLKQAVGSLSPDDIYAVSGFISATKIDRVMPAR